MKIPELLAPAGSLQALDAAIGEGADAVYIGLKDSKAQPESAGFTYAQFEGALISLRRRKIKTYVTINSVFEQREADRTYQMLKYLAEQGPDALIVQDFGVIAMARQEFPSLRLHASSQMNIASARGANALSRHGVSRVALAREMAHEELRSIKSETNLELEVFAHGAPCISVSGLCLFSSFLGGKSANRGMCTQACRRSYQRINSDMSIGESGCFFSLKDLQLLEQVPDLADMGITALRIESQPKNAFYISKVVSAYRLVLDAVASCNEVSRAEGDVSKINNSIKKGSKILRGDSKYKRYTHIIEKTPGGKGPGRDKSPPLPKLPETAASGKQPTFPEGLYVAVSHPEDLYIVQSSRPQRVILVLSRKNAKYLLAEGKPPLPFKPAEIILSLDPWFPQEDAGYETGNEVSRTKEIEQLIEKGYLQYMLNNPGHFSLFKTHDKVKLIAGPWLYMFNSWALSFCASLGFDGFVSPLENNRQNLERTCILQRSFQRSEASGRKKRNSINALHSRFFVTVFSWPPLFTIKPDPGLNVNLLSDNLLSDNLLSDNLLSDNRGETFSIITDTEGTCVYPKKYFSIIDKIPFLKESGYRRFIIDLCGTVIKKTDYRDLMRAVKENVRPLPNSSRFNWKDGFYNVQNTTGSSSFSAAASTTASFSPSENSS